jgi:Tfp pilus assembly PilM family ATPase
MAFSMFSTQASPIAIDFGASSVKMLQIGTGERPEIVAACELATPDAVRFETNERLAFWAEHLPRMLREGSFKGRRAIIAVPSAHTFIQHMQLAKVEGANRDDLIKGQLQSQMGCHPDAVVVRSIDVAEVHRNGQVRNEIICLAITRETIMRFIELLKRCRLDVIGAHTETISMVRAFNHLHRREADCDITTLYVDLGWSGTRVAITHGRDIAFARTIQIGGRHFDQQLASVMQCDVAGARAHRLSMQAPATPTTGAEADRHADDDAGRGPWAEAPGADASGTTTAQPEAQAQTTATGQVERRTSDPPAELRHAVVPNANVGSPGGVGDLAELLDTIADELSMCLRYHQGLFPQRSVDRAIFLGGEARQLWLCQHLVSSLRVPAQLGDPLARLPREGLRGTPGLDLTRPQPGWAVACGLCTAPTDL